MSSLVKAALVVAMGVVALATPPAVHGAVMACDTFYHEPECNSWSQEFRDGYCYAKCPGFEVATCTTDPVDGRAGIICWDAIS